MDNDDNDVNFSRMNELKYREREETLLPQVRDWNDKQIVLS